MEQLKLHVERIVRPIRGGVGRKNKMREELLAHLMEKTKAMVDGGADESAACAEAIKQLGDPALLRAELQASVPALERVAYMRFPDFGFFDNYFEKADGESTLHFALVRTGFIALVLGSTMLVTWLVLLPFRQHPMREPSYCVMMLSFFYVSTVVSNFFVYYLADVSGLGRFMSKTSPSSGWVKGGALCLFICAGIVLMFGPILLLFWIVKPADAIILVGVFSGSWRELALGFALFLLVILVTSGAAMKFEQEQWAKWGQLHVNDE